MSQLIDPALAQKMAENGDLAAQRLKFDAMRRELNNGVTKTKKEKLREACEGFEAVFIQKMWEQMRATVPENGILHSKDEKIWQGMYDQELSKKMAGAGGIGLADMMMSQLGKNLEEAGAKTLNTSLNQRLPIPIAPAPLLLDAALKISEKSVPPAGDDIYSAMIPSVPDIEDESDTGDEAEILAGASSEFNALVAQIQAERQQAAVTVTRIITNSNSIGAFNSIKTPSAGRVGAGARSFRQVAPQNVPQGIMPQPKPAPGPGLSPTAVSQSRASGLESL